MADEAFDLHPIADETNIEHEIAESARADAARMLDRIRDLIVAPGANPVRALRLVEAYARSQREFMSQLTYTTDSEENYADDFIAPGYNAPFGNIAVQGGGRDIARPRGLRGTANVAAGTANFNATLMDTLATVTGAQQLQALVASLEGARRIGDETLIANIQRQIDRLLNLTREPVEVPVEEG